MTLLHWNKLLKIHCCIYSGKSGYCANYRILFMTLALDGTSLIRDVPAVRLISSIANTLPYYLKINATIHMITVFS